MLVCVVLASYAWKPSYRTGIEELIILKRCAEDDKCHIKRQILNFSIQNSTALDTEGFMLNVLTVVGRKSEVFRTREQTRYSDEMDLTMYQCNQAIRTFRARVQRSFACPGRRLY